MSEMVPHIQETTGAPPDVSPVPNENGETGLAAGHGSSFCVALRRASGRPEKMFGTSPSQFVSFMSDSTISWLNFAVNDMKQDVLAVGSELGFSPSLVTNVLASYHSAYEDFDTELGLMLPAVIVHDLDVTVEPLIILMKRDIIVTIHPRMVTRLVKFARYAEMVFRKIPANLPAPDKLTMVLHRIIDENNEKNFEGLRSIEEQGDKIGRFLLDPQTPRKELAPQIYLMKHALIVYLDSLWATLDVIRFLRHGDPDLLTDNIRLLERIGILGDDVNRQISLSEHMSEVLASGLEVLQSIYNNQLQILNNRMAMVMTWLTILGTAVLVPNTLATVFSSAAYNIGPEDVWWYSALLVGSTILSTAAAYWFVRLKGWLPKAAD